MRILQLITRNELRGAEVFAAQLSQQLALRGHAVCLASLYVRLRSNEAGLHPPQVEVAELGGKTKGRLEVRAFWRLRQVLRSFRPDVVQANGFHALKYLAVLKSLGICRQPVVYRNISQASRWIRGGLHRRYSGWVARHADVVLSVSDSGAADFAEAFSYPAARVQTLRRGIDLPDALDRGAARRRVAEITGCDPSDLLLFHLGGFTEEKNHGALLESFALLRVRHPRARLVLCGDGPLRSSIETAIAKRKLSEHVFCLGNRDDARELLAGGDLLLLTSHVEGVPGVVLEAAARRVPSVATDVGAVDEAIRHGETGLLVPPGDIAGFAQAADSLLNDAAYRLQMGEQGRQFIAERHEMAGVIGQFEQVYRDLVNSHSPHVLQNSNTAQEVC